jgi:hypothetical protein
MIAYARALRRYMVIHMHETLGSNMFFLVVRPWQGKSTIC